MVAIDVSSVSRADDGTNGILFHFGIKLSTQCCDISNMAFISEILKGNSLHKSRQYYYE